MGYIPVPTPDGAACGCADQQSCRFVIARLAALVPSPRVNLTRFHAVFAPDSHWRAPITPAGRGRERRSLRADQTPSAGEPHRARRRAQHLKRVFNFDIETCARCGAPIKIIASIGSKRVWRRSRCAFISGELGINPLAGTLPTPALPAIDRQARHHASRVWPASPAPAGGDSARQVINMAPW